VERHVLRWRNTAGDGLEHAVVLVESRGVFVRGHVVGPDFGLCYSLRCAPDWRALFLEVSTADGESLTLSSDGQGTWFDGAGRPFEALDDCDDLDLAVTPLTNTLAIRRLTLAAGDGAEVDVAYVAAPELEVSRERQRYTRLDARRWRFESDGGAFVREIEVDAYGFVESYPGLFERV
jgi:hypothetical protein